MPLCKNLTCLRAMPVSMAVVILTMLAPAVSDAGEADPGRHPRRFSPARRPISVPSEFVLTHSGFMHPSCVITIHSDEVASPEGGGVVIRGPDGAERFRSGPCPYPRYWGDGELAALAKTESGESAETAEAGTRAQAVRAGYDGWLCSFQSDGSFDPGSTLVTEWYVPALPTKTGRADIALFNDIVTTAEGGDILQPVLDFGELPNTWAIESEHCCLGGNDIQSDLVAVSPGDLIRGTVAPSNCDDSGTCANWKVTTLDVTTGESTITNTTETSGKAYAIHPGALESFGITSCDMLPANGEATFFNNTLTSPSGTTYELSYNLQVIRNREQGSQLPLDCGYDGEKSDESFTLIWQQTHYPISGTEGVGGADGSDGGLGNGGAAGADGPLTDSGGAAGSAGNESSAGSSAAGGTNTASGGTALDGAAGSGGSFADGASGTGASEGFGSSAGGRNGASGGSAGSAIGGGGTSTVQSSGGTSDHAGMVAPGGGSSSDGKGAAGAQADAGTVASASSAGCSCTVGQSRSASRFAWLLAVALVLGQLRRSRRR